MVEFKITRQEISIYKERILDRSVLVTPDDAAKILSVTPRTVRNYVREGRLGGYNAAAGNKGLRILASELAEYVRSIRLRPEDLDL